MIAVIRLSVSVGEWPEGPDRGQHDVLRPDEVAGSRDVRVERRTGSDPPVDGDVDTECPDHPTVRSEHPHATEQEQRGVPGPGERRVDGDDVTDPRQSARVAECLLRDQPTLAVRDHRHLTEVLALEVPRHDQRHVRDRTGVVAEVADHVHRVSAPEQVVGDRLQEPPVLEHARNQQDRRPRRRRGLQQPFRVRPTDHAPDGPADEVDVVEEPSPQSPAPRRRRRRHRGELPAGAHHGRGRYPSTAASPAAASRSMSSTSALSSFFWTFSARFISRSIFAPMSETPTTTRPA